MSLARALQHHGFELIREKRHRIYRDREGRTLTPSDWRAEREALSDLARLLGKKKRELLPDRRRLRGQREHLQENLPKAGLPEVIEVKTASVEIVPPAPAPAVEAKPAPVTWTKGELKKLKRLEKLEGLRAAKQERQMAVMQTAVRLVHEWTMEQSERIHPDTVAWVMAEYMRSKGYQDARVVRVLAHIQDPSRNLDRLVEREITEVPWAGRYVYLDHISGSAVACETWEIKWDDGSSIQCTVSRELGPLWTKEKEEEKWQMEK